MSPVPLRYENGWPQSQSECSGKEKYPLVPAGNKKHLLGCETQSTVTIATELCCLLLQNIDHNFGNVNSTAHRRIKVQHSPRISPTLIQLGVTAFWNTSCICVFTKITTNYDYFHKQWQCLLWGMNWIYYYWWHAMKSSTVYSIHVGCFKNNIRYT